MLSHLHVTPLEIGLVVIALVSLAVAFRLRQLRVQAYKRSILFRTPDDEESSAAPTARQWLARETAMNDLPPPREASSYDSPHYDVPRYEPPSYDPIPPPSAPATEERPSYSAADDDYRAHQADDAIVFPSSHGFVDYSNAELPPPRA